MDTQYDFLDNTTDSEINMGHQVDLQEQMCSYEQDDITEICSLLQNDTCGGCRVAMPHRFLEILDFTQFFDHFVFTPNEENVLEKELKREIPVSVGIELVVVDMSRNLDFMG